MIMKSNIGNVILYWHTREDIVHDGTLRVLETAGYLENEKTD